MKKAIKTSKLSSTSKLVRRVLSRTSNVTKTSGKSKSNNQVMDSSESSTKSLNVSFEISALKEQINVLKAAVSSMQVDAENKEKALASLAREKEKLASDLKKQKRSNFNLKQQLEDEREYYHKEKERYCQEMNECKQLKQQMLESETSLVREDNLENKNEISKLKEALNQTLQANYNLSIKFLRMKNTKTYLQNMLKTLKEDHDKAMTVIKQQTQDLRSTLHFVVSKQFESPISPSNKKFLKIVKENGNLVHENLCLQLEIDKLAAQMEKYKRHIFRNQTKNKLPYINNDNKSKSNEKVEKKVVFAAKDIKTAFKSQKQSSEDKSTLEKTRAMIRPKPRYSEKLREKKRAAEAPEITEILPAKPNNECKFESTTQSKISTRIEESDADLALVQISENPSQFSMERTEFSSCTTSRIAIRTQSAPEIIETSSFPSDLR